MPTEGETVTFAVTLPYVADTFVAFNNVIF